MLPHSSFKFICNYTANSGPWQQDQQVLQSQDLRHLATQGYQTKRLKQLLLRNHMAFVVNLLRVDSSSKE